MRFRNLITATLGCLLALGASASPKLGDPCPLQGTRLPLGKDAFLDLSIEDKAIQAHLVDAANRLIEIPVASVTLVVEDPGHRQNKWRAVLLPVSPFRLSSPRLFFGPNTFRAKIIVQFEDRSPMASARTRVNLDNAS